MTQSRATTPLFVVLAIVLIIATSYSVYSAYKVPPPPLPREIGDIVDDDFTALIAKTDQPLVFNVEVKRVNDKVDKTLGVMGVVVRLTLYDSNGKVYKDSLNVQYSESVDGSFEMLKSSNLTKVSGPVKLITDHLKPGVYKIKPRVRIYEVGKDALSSSFKDFGSVGVPAGNFVTVQVK